MRALCETLSGEGYVTTGYSSATEALAALRPGIFDVSKLTSASLTERAASYQPQAAALSAYFLMSLPAATPDRAVTSDWRVGIADRDETPFAVSDPFNDSQ